MARDMKGFDKKIDKFESKTGRHRRILNPWIESRFMLSSLESRTGKSFTGLYENMVGDKNESSDIISNTMEETLDTAGIKRHQVVLANDQALAVSDYLFESTSANRDELYNLLDPRSQAVARGIDELLQGPIANEVRQARWYQWNDQFKFDQLKVAKATLKAAKKGEILTAEQFDKLTKGSRDLIPANVVDKVTDYETVLDESGEIDTVETQRNRTNAATDILKEGIIANEAGQLKDWISGQKWGTRAHYYMTENRVSDLTDYITSSTVGELTSGKSAKAGTLGTEIGATKERLSEGRKKGSKTIVKDIMGHWDRVASFNAVHDDLVSFWDNFDSAITEHGRTNTDDVTEMRNLIGNMLGKPVRGDELSDVAGKISNTFWGAMFGDISRAMKFGIRNAPAQNVAFLGANMNVTELHKAMARKATGRGTSVKDLENFEVFRDSVISQKRQIAKHYTQSNDVSQTREFGSKLSMLSNTVSAIAMQSDALNRFIAYPLVHEVAAHNLDLLQDGKIDYNTFTKRLQIDSMDNMYGMGLEALVNTGKSPGTDTEAIRDEFLKRYINYKVLGTHFGYDLKHKSLLEQKPGNRQALGPVTYARGRAQILNKTITQPLKNGFQNRDAKQMKEGVGNLFKFIVGSAAASAGLGAVGIKAYNLISDSIYTPVQPGITKLLEATNEIKFAISEAGDDVTTEQTVVRIADIIGNLTEVSVPMLNTLSNFYEAQNDVKGVTTMRRVQNLLYERGYLEKEKIYKDMNRDTIERIGHVLWNAERDED
jgi:hypothetical protein